MKKSNTKGHPQIIKELYNGAGKIIKVIRKIYNSLSSPETLQARKHLSRAWKNLSLARKAVKDKKSEDECFIIFVVKFNETSTELKKTKNTFRSPKLKQERKRIKSLLEKIPEKYRTEKIITDGGSL